MSPRPDVLRSTGLCEECGGPCSSHQYRCTNCQEINAMVCQEERELRDSARRRRPHLVKTAWHCIAGDPAQPRDFYHQMEAMNQRLELGYCEPGSVWERQGEKYVVVGEVGKQQRMEPLVQA